LEECSALWERMHTSRQTAPGLVARELAFLLVAGLCLAGARASPPPTPLLALRLPLQRLGSLYRAALARRPVLTHCVQGAAISGVGDFACQLYAAKHDHVDKGLRPHTLSLEQVPFLSALCDALTP